MWNYRFITGRGCDNGDSRLGLAPAPSPSPLVFSPPSLPEQPPGAGYGSALGTLLLPKGVSKVIVADI